MEVINAGASGITSAYAAQCLKDTVDADADLVLIEFAVNDYEMLTAKGVGLVWSGVLVLSPVT